MEVIESYEINGKLYLNTKFLCVFFNKSEKQVGRWKKDGMPIAKKPKELNKRGDYYILEKVIEWVDKNINKTKSSNSSARTVDIDIKDIVLDDEERLFEIYTTGNSNQKKRLLLRLDQNRLDNFKKIEDIIEKEAKNKEYDSKYALIEKVKKGQQELASVFISMLKTSMPELSKELENKTQDEVYHSLDRRFKKEIDKLRAYIGVKEDVEVTLNEIIQAIVDAIGEEKTTQKEILKKIKELTNE
jgi:hypothetical protein